MKPRSLQDLTTERANPRSTDLDLKPALEIARIINAEDAKVAGAVQRALPQIARAISGRMGALDASEIPPTFATSPALVQFIIAGGPKALGAEAEASEDSSELGHSEMVKRKPSKKDVLIGIAASGRTPFTIAALEYARSRGAQTIALTCNPDSPLERAAHFAIVTDVGPEVLTGSSRMKAGTAQKMVLNMITTGAMTRLGYVYGNLMVNLRLKNSKLSERGITILQNAAEVDREQARQALQSASNDVPVALVMLKAHVLRAQARRALKATNGHVRKAIAVAQKSKRP
ncbi:MAG: N-acetylmuramic acid 6-phosphate etherase [Acidobacteria bacterium]|nr:MAG: N-acetylmuramic acid 6-phosphate etherase [Acidobacteriota bacterium]